MDELQKTVVTGGDEAYLVFGFIHQQDGKRMLSGGSEGLRSFLYWYDVIRECNNEEFLELYLWKFFVYLPEISRRIVVDKFRRDGLAWELEQIEGAERKRRHPSQEELSPPPADRTRWVSSPDRAEQAEKRFFLRDPLLVFTIGIVALIVARSIAASLQGKSIWRQSIGFVLEWGQAIPHLLRTAFGVPDSSLWLRLPIWIYPVIALWTCFYVCFVVLDVFGKREIASIAKIWGASGAQRDLKTRFGSALQNIGRHCLAFLVGPFILSIVIGSFFKLKRNYTEIILSFHINIFKVHLVSHGISLVGFDDGIEMKEFINRAKVDLRTNQRLLFRAIALYLTPFLAAIAIIQMGWVDYRPG